MPNDATIWRVWHVNHVVSPGVLMPCGVPLSSLFLLGTVANFTNVLFRPTLLLSTNL